MAKISDKSSEILAELIGLFAETLGLKTVGVQDHFFERGGHSRQAVALADRIQKRLVLDFPVRFIYQNPTPSLLAEAVAKHLEKS